MYFSMGVCGGFPFIPIQLTSGGAGWLHQVAIVLFRFLSLTLVRRLPHCRSAGGGLADGVSGAGLVQGAAGGWLPLGAWAAAAACFGCLRCECATFRVQCPSTHRPERV